MNDKFTGLLGDPMLQIGLGILANNTGNRGAFAPAFGRGVMQGMNNAQEFAQQQQLLKLREDQIANQSLLFNARVQEIKAQQEEAARINAARERFKQANPNLSDAADIDFKTAYKAANPQLAGEAKPYYTPIYDVKRGLGSFDTRTGLASWQDGEPIVRPQDDPNNRGAIKTAEGYGSTFGSNTADAGLPMPTFGVPTMSYIPPTTAPTKKPPVSPAPSTFPSVSPTVQGKRDNKRTQILNDELASEKRALFSAKTPEERATHQRNIDLLNAELGNQGVVKVPTKAEIDAASAGAKRQAEANVDLKMKPQITAADETAKVTSKATAEAALDLPKVINQGEQTIKLVDDLVNSKGFETAVGLSSKLDPRNYLAGTDATDFKIRLDQLKGQQFLQAFESLKGGGQITEVEGKKATDAISRMNTAQSEEEFKAAANEFKGVIKQGVERAKQKAGGAPSSGQVFNELPPPNKYKGKIIRNPDTGERMQSDGMRWKAL